MNLDPLSVDHDHSKNEFTLKAAQKRKAKDLKKLEEHEDISWLDCQGNDLAIPVIAQLRMRRGSTKIILKKSSAEGLSTAGELATAGLNERMIEIDNSINTGIKGQLTGAKLSAITQALTYQLIRQTHPSPLRKVTLQHIDITRWEVAERTGSLPTSPEIWKSFSCKDLRKPIQVFLWRMAHGAYKIGQYWDHI